MNSNDCLFVNEKKYKPIPLRTENLCDAYGSYWFTSFNFNALFKMDKDTLRARFVCSFPGEVEKGRLYSKVVAGNNRLYCIPLSANGIGVYDVDSGDSFTISIEKPRLKGQVLYNEESKFFDAVIKDGFLYLFPHTYPAIARVELEKNQIEYNYQSIKTIEQPAFDKSFYFSKMASNNFGKLFFSNVSKCVYQFDFSAMVFNKVFESRLAGGGVIAAYEDKIWLYSNADNCIFLYNEKSIGKLMIHDDEYNPGSFPITRSAVYGDYAYFSPGTANYPVKVNVKTNEVSIAKEIAPIVLNLQDREVWKFGLVEVMDNKLFMYDATSSKLLIHDNIDNTVKRCFILHEDDDRETRQLIEGYWVGAMKHMSKITDLKSLLQYMR